MIASQVVIVVTCGATRDDQVGTMMTRFSVFVEVVHVYFNKGHLRP